MKHTCFILLTVFTFVSFTPASFARTEEEPFKKRFWMPFGKEEKKVKKPNYGSFEFTQPEVKTHSLDELTEQNIPWWEKEYIVRKGKRFL